MVWWTNCHVYVYDKIERVIRGGGLIMLYSGRFAYLARVMALLWSRLRLLAPRVMVVSV